MPKKKTAASAKSTAKKASKASAKESKESNEVSIITDIVNSGLNTTIKEKPEVEVVEETSSQSNKEETHKSSQKRVLEESNLEDDESELTIGKQDKAEAETEADSMSQNKQEGIFEKLVDAMQKHSDEPAKMQKHEVSDKATDGFNRQYQDGNEKVEKKASSQDESKRLKYDPTFIAEKREHRSHPEKLTGARFTGTPTAAPRTDTYQRRANHVDNFDPRSHGHHRGRGPFMPHRGRFPARGNYNQPICPPGMEFQPYFPLHPQMPDPNFGHVYPFPPVYPPSEGQLPHPPQYGYPADGFIDPAWYLPQQNFPARGMGRGQLNFTRYGNGRGREDSSNGRGGRFNPHRGGY